METSPKDSGVGLIKRNTTNRRGGGRFVFVISVKISHGSGSECGGSRLTDRKNQELGGNKARDI